MIVDMAFLTRKTDLEEKKLLPEENAHGLGIQRKLCKKIVDFRRLWVKDARPSETVSAKKRHTSIVARVLDPIRPTGFRNAS